MKILLDVSSVKYPLVGIGNYTVELAKRLPYYAETFYVYNGKLVEFEDLIINQNVKSIGSKDFPFKSFLRNIYNKGCEYRIDRLKKYIGKDVIYHEPNFILRSFSGINVITVHDLSHIRHPDFHPDSRVKYLNNNLRKSVEKSNGVIAISKFVSNEISDVFNRRDCEVVYNGYSRFVDSVECCDKFKELSNYFLVVGTIEPRKNIINLVLSYEKLVNSNVGDVPDLILAGVLGWKDDELIEILNKVSCKNKIAMLGYVNETELDFLYRKCFGVIYPSFYEGFGLPALEALSYSKPLITSSNTAMPEFLDGNAIFVDPYSVDSIFNGLMIMLTDKVLVSYLSENGDRISRKYTWDLTCEKTVDFYKKLI